MKPHAEKTLDYNHKWSRELNFGVSCERLDPWSLAVYRSQSCFRVAYCQRETETMFVFFQQTDPEGIKVHVDNMYKLLQTAQEPPSRDTSVSCCFMNGSVFWVNHDLGLLLLLLLLQYFMFSFLDLFSSLNLNCAVVSWNHHHRRCDGRSSRTSVYGVQWDLHWCVSFLLLYSRDEDEDESVAGLRQERARLTATKMPQLEKRNRTASGVLFIFQKTKNVYISVIFLVVFLHRWRHKG